MNRLTVVALMGLALTGCDNSSDYVQIQDGDKSQIVNVTHFPEYVSVNGERVYPDKDGAVDSAGSEMAMYEFAKQKDNGGWSTTFTNVKLSRCESGCVSGALGWITSESKPQWVTAWRVLTGKAYFGEYSHNTINGASADDVNVLSGQIKGWSK